MDGPLALPTKIFLMRKGKTSRSTHSRRHMKLTSRPPHATARAQHHGLDSALTHLCLFLTRERPSGVLQCIALLLAGDKRAPPSPLGVGGDETKTYRPSYFSPLAHVTGAREVLLAALISSTISDNSVAFTTDNAACARMRPRRRDDDRRITCALRRV